MKRNVVLIILIIICLNLGVFGFMKNKSNASSNKENKEENIESKEENKVKTYQPVKYTEDLESSKITRARIYGNSEVIYLVDYGNKTFYTLKNNKLESVKTFTSNNEFEVLKPINQLDDSQSVLYTFVENNGKIGVTDNKGNTILNTEFDKNNSNKIYKLDDKYYFFLSKKGEKYLYNSDGKLIYEFKDYYEYSFSKYYDNFIMMNIENEVIKSLDFYDKNFKHIKNENLEKYNIKYSDVVENKYASDEYSLKYTSIKNIMYSYGNTPIFPLKDNKVLVIDENLNIKEIKNLFSHFEGFSSDDTFYYSENYYVTYNEENNKAYNIYSSNDDLIVSNLYDVDFIYPSGDVDYGDGSLLICKEKDKCTIMNKYGKIVIDYKYSKWEADVVNVVILSNDTETYFYSMIEGVKDWTCNLKSKESSRYFWLSYMDNDYMIIDYNLYKSNCEKIGEGYSRILDRYYDMIFAENKEGLLVVLKNEEVVYTSNEKVYNSKLIDNKFYFIMNSSLYYIEL